jgi:hypothetical protein
MIVNKLFFKDQEQVVVVFFIDTFAPLYKNKKIKI